MLGEHLGSTSYKQTFLQSGGAGIREAGVDEKTEKK